MCHVTSGFAPQLGMSVTSIHGNASSNLNNDRALSSQQFSGEEEGILLKI